MRILPLLLLLVGCRGITGPVAAASEFIPPAYYRDWFVKTESCAGLTGRFHRIKFHVVANDTFYFNDHLAVAGWEGNDIYISERYLAHEMVVRHEMLHFLLQRDGHPKVYFEDLCRLTWDTWGGNFIYP